MAMTPDILEGAAELLGRYDAVLCDVWGVVHDGVTAYAEAGEALSRFRASGGTVVLVSNAPRGAEAVECILAQKQVRPDAWDAIVSSGDLARAFVAKQGFARVHHIGPRRDDDLFETMTASRVPFDEAEALVVTGLNDDRQETGESYRAMLAEARARRLPLVCANPDLVVHVGGRALPCAGAIAAVYEAMGGEVYWAGKPHRPAYEQAHRVAERLRGGPVAANRMLAIGDSVRTDLAGADAFGIDTLFIAQGIHHAEVMQGGRIVPERLAALLEAAAAPPVAAMAGLAW